MRPLPRRHAPARLPDNPPHATTTRRRCRRRACLGALRRRSARTRSAEQALRPHLCVAPGCGKRLRRWRHAPLPSRTRARRRCHRARRAPRARGARRAAAAHRGADPGRGQGGRARLVSEVREVLTLTQRNPNPNVNPYLTQRCPNPNPNQVRGPFCLRVRWHAAGASAPRWRARARACALHLRQGQRGAHLRRALRGGPGLWR